MINRILAAMLALSRWAFACLALGLAPSTSPAISQTYKDSGGTIVPGVVIVDPVDNSGPLFSTTNPGKVSAANPSTVYSGQQTATGSAAALPSQAFVNGVVITAKTTNSGTVYVGPSGVTASTGYPLAAGQSISYAVANLSAIYILDSTSGDGVAFTGN